MEGDSWAVPGFGSDPEFLLNTCGVPYLGRDGLRESCEKQLLTWSLMSGTLAVKPYLVTLEKFLHPPEPQFPHVAR